VPDERKKLRQEYIGGSDTPTYYANQVNALATQYDLRLRFSQVEDVSGERILYKEVVTVYLSPAEARALRRLLSLKAADYDKLWSQGFTDNSEPTETDGGEHEIEPEKQK
jgi:hypothetical protein